MYDIFDPALEAVANERGIHLLPAKEVSKPAHTSEFTMAASNDRSFFKSGVSMLYNLELLDARRDHLHHRNSGLDSTTAKLAATQGILIGINLANLRAFDPVVMGRIMQNIELCRQHKAQMAVFSNAQTAAELANPADVQSLLRVLGMSSQQAKSAMQNLENAHRALQAKRKR
jgi:hypothetical protein